MNTKINQLGLEDIGTITEVERKDGVIMLRLDSHCGLGPVIYSYVSEQMLADDPDAINAILRQKYEWAKNEKRPALGTTKTNQAKLKKALAQYKHLQPNEIEAFVNQHYHEFTEVQSAEETWAEDWIKVHLFEPATAIFHAFDDDAKGYQESYSYLLVEARNLLQLIPPGFLASKLEELEDECLRNLEGQE